MTIKNRVSSFVRIGGAVSCAALLLLSGCGGGASPSASETPVSVPPPSVVVTPPVTTLAGTVAVGAPMLNATVTVKDANGTTRSATASSDGSYSGLSIAGMVPPFSVQACGLVDGNYTCFHAVVTKPGVANVTPLTNATVALALGSDPAGVFAATGATTPPAAAEIDAQTAKLKAALANLLAKAGLTNVDFATTPFAADRTGVDKLLDSIKVSAGIDGATSKSFVQVEGKIGAGNVFLNKETPVTTALPAATGVDVDLKGISTIFVNGMSNAIAAADQATCATRLNAANIFDDSFSLEIDNGVIATKTSAAAMICRFADSAKLLGGGVANPVLRDCDFTSDASRKLCTVGFTLVHGEESFDGAELTVVLRPGADWKLLGNDSPYKIHVGAAVQRMLRLDLPAGDAKAAPSYTRALTFDVSANDGVSATGIRAAKIYQRDLDGSGWELTPLVTLTLTDTCIAQLRTGETARLGVVGSSCGSSWVSLGDTGDSASAAAKGDMLIDNFYKRGRKVKVELFNNVAATGTPIVVIKRADGVPPKAAALATFPWLEIDNATKSALVGYDGVAPSFTAAWIKNPSVSAKDISFCLAGNCSGAARAGHENIVNGHTSQTLTLSAKPANAAAYKSIGLYGRTSEQLGVSTNYVSCGGAAICQ